VSELRPDYASVSRTVVESGVKRPLPAATVTFLFTDIEGSTRLLRELGDDYADLSRRAPSCVARRSNDTGASRWTPMATRSSSRSLRRPTRSPLRRRHTTRSPRGRSECAWDCTPVRPTRIVQRRELVVAELVEPLRRREVGETVHAESLDQTNLPVQPSPFVGREQELADVLALLATNRIVIAYYVDDDVDRAETLWRGRPGAASRTGRPA
jgi:hypothetical protein